MKKYKLVAAFFIAFVALSLSGCDAFTGTDAQTVIHNIEQPTLQQNNNINVRGTVESTESRNVYTMLGLTIQQVYAQEGDFVNEGQALAVLDTGDLELTISQQRATLEATRQSTQNAVQEARRMLTEAETNLVNNTNMHILTAEASLSAAEIGLQMARQNYDNAIRDYQESNNPQVLTAESFLRTARTELETMQTSHDNAVRLFDAGVVNRDELRLSENALTHLQNQYSDAQAGYNNAIQFQQRTIEQLRITLQSAETSYANARELVNAARSAARQEVEMLRGSLATAEIAANLEPMEIAIQLLKRQLEDSTITSPINGTVTAVIAREGAAGMGLMFVVEDIDNLRIITGFREYDISQISTGMEVTIIPDATGDIHYKGVISRINPAASPFSQVVEFEAEILVTSENPSLRIGMNTRLEISPE